MLGFIGVLFCFVWPPLEVNSNVQTWVKKVWKHVVLQFDVFSTVHHSIELFHQPTLMHNFLYSLTICLLHCYPRHVSSINMSIFRRENCIHTASGIFALCKRLHSTLVESGHVEDNSVTNILLMNKENCALKLVGEIILCCLAFGFEPRS